MKDAMDAFWASFDLAASSYGLGVAFLGCWSLSFLSSLHLFETVNTRTSIGHQLALSLAVEMGDHG